jgi:hypothetical protein
MENTIYKLGPLECVSSGFINALLLWGEDPKYFLANYWNVDYFRQLIMGSRHIHLCFPKLLYGIQFADKRAAFDVLPEIVKSGDMIIILCRASQLAYFPRHMLGYEGRDIGHTFLVHAVEGETFRIIDPMADFAGKISFQEVRQLANAAGELSFFQLSRIKGFQAPDAKEIFQNAVNYNHKIFTQHLFNFGRKAFKLFAGDIKDSVGWEKTAREQWCKQNTLTISSICKTRQVVWQALQALQVLPASVVESIDADIKTLVGKWQNVNLLLLKFGHNHLAENIVDKLLDKIQAVSTCEEAVLLKLKNRGTDEECRA